MPEYRSFPFVAGDFPQVFRILLFEAVDYVRGPNVSALCFEEGDEIGFHGGGESWVRGFDWGRVLIPPFNHSAICRFALCTRGCALLAGLPCDGDRCFELAAVPGCAIVQQAGDFGELDYCWID